MGDTIQQAGARPKSPSLAFEPTPNDALAPPSLSSGTSSPSAMARTIPHRESVSSASRLPSVGSTQRTSRARSPDVSPFQLPIGHSDGLDSVLNGTFSPLDNTATQGDEDGWQQLYNQGQELLEHERQLWKRERQVLTSKIARLEQELLVAKTKVKQQELAAEDPDSYLTRTISNGTSRSDSRSSYSEENTTPAKKPPILAMTYASPGRLFANGTSRLPSIEETDRTPRSSKSLQRSTSLQGRRPPVFPSLGSALSARPVKRASLDDRNGTPGHSVSIGSPNSLKITEIPYDPPPTHAALSPHPEDYIRHAGHTPGMSEALSKNQTPGRHTPTKTNTEQNSVLTQPDGFEDEDPALTGPLMLPTNPENGSDILSHLESKLQGVTQNKQSRRPTCLQGTESTDDESNVGDNEFDREGEEGEGEKTPAATVPDEPPGGIRLKTKASMNFGAPLGKLH